MATFRQFEEIVAWQRARELAVDVYRASASGPLRKEFVLRDQILRAAISTMANIAEGFERDGNREFLQFLAIAKGSVGELRSHLHLAHSQGLLTESDLRRLFALAQETSLTIGGLMGYLRSCSLKGKKFDSAKNSKLGTRNSKLEKEPR
jgi:four helix bundle protein